MITHVPSLTLNDGNTIPQLGLGVYQLSNDEAYASIREAITLGVRHIDTAAIYENEAAVGRAIADAIDAGDVTRDDLFITTKVWNSEQGYDTTLAAMDESLKLLGLDYVDLYLIHWPGAEKGRYNDTWRALEELQKQGKTKSIGVCNFYPEVLDDLIKTGSVVPAVNQVELHPGFSQPDVREYDDKAGIKTEAWAPLGQGKILGEPLLVEIAKAHSVTPAQVAIRWNLQLGNIVFPRSSKPERVKENFDVFGFELTDQEMSDLTGLDATGGRLSGDPHTFLGGF